MLIDSSRIYRYVVRYDAGSAPRPFGGLCSLAICKPKIRSAARVGDWIIGFRSRRPGEVVFVMRVSECMPLGDYWADPRFADRRPGASVCPDNIYRIGAHGQLQQVPNEVHSLHDAPTDISGKSVLLADRFWYFGSLSVPLPNHLMHLAHTGRGHAVHKNRRATDSKHLARWLAAWAPGIHGDPVDGGVGADRALEPRSPKSKCGSGPRAKEAAMFMPKAPAASCHGVRDLGRTGHAALQEAFPSRAEGPRKLVLSRKGFDAGYGRIPSPILPDGRLLPLPIPVGHDGFRLGDLNTRGVDIAPLLGDLSRGRHSVDTTVHMDPDLDRKPELQLPGWRPALGQSGSAQSHLASRGVGPGDVMLFFGWFRQVEQVRGRWRYARDAPDLHVLFGWLEVDEVWPIVQQRAQILARHPWTADHPHVARPDHYTNPLNTLYIAPKRSALVPGRTGGGKFSSFSKALQLTAEGKSRSVWSLPEWFHPSDGREPLSYHRAPERWSRVGGACGLRSVAKGQEFVLDIEGREQAVEWIKGLIAAH